MFKVGDDFDKIQASRPDFKRDAPVTFSKPPNPNWKQGDGANDGGESLKKSHVEINPYEEGRPVSSNWHRSVMLKLSITTLLFSLLDSLARLRRRRTR